MSMTKKDYELIAEWMNKYTYMATIRHSSDGGTTTELHWYQNAPEALASALEIDNPQFDRKRFLEACGVTL